MAWKRGVKIQAMVLTGSAPGTAGQRFGRTVGSGTAVGAGTSPARVGAGLGVGASCRGRQPDEQDEGHGQDGDEAELDAPIGGHEVSVILPWRSRVQRTGS